MKIRGAVLNAMGVEPPDAVTKPDVQTPPRRRGLCTLML